MEHSIADACVGMGKIFFFDDITQSLCEISDLHGSIKVLAVNDNKFFESGNIFFDRGNLYVASRRSLDLLKYDGHSKTIKTISQKDIAINQNGLFDHHMISEHRLWSFPNYMNQSICYFDLNSCKIVKDRVIKKNDGNMSTRFSSGFADCYWSALYKTNKYLKFDLKQRKIQLYETSSEIHAAAICFDGKYLWISSADNSEIYKCTETGEVLERFDGKGEAGGETFARLYTTDQYMIALPRFGDFIFFIDKGTDDVKRFYLEDIDFNLKINANKASKFLKCLKYKNKLLFFGFGIDAFIIIDIDGMKIQNLPMIFSKEDIERINYANITRNNLTVENKYLNLENLKKAVLYEIPVNKTNIDFNEYKLGTFVYKQLSKGRKIK